MSLPVSLLLLFSNLQAEVLKHEISMPQYKEFSYAEVCDLMGAKNAVLISLKSLIEIECLNKSYHLIDFCLKQFPLEKILTRGYVDLAKKKVVCEMSESIMLSVSCDQRDLKYCFNPKKGCEELGKIYANRLEIAHFSMLEKNLNCYFSKHIGESLNEI
ncbi:MAG: hypothetical protein PHY93_02760 [Bacteriovorax sp.]|nr:hypothetical protein [Bacteriovorax sp.]